MRENYQTMGGAIGPEGVRSARLRAADWFALAAAPAFAIMALLTALGAQPPIICGMMDDMSPLQGMIPMYVLMSLFHLPPWFRLVSVCRK